MAWRINFDITQIEQFMTPKDLNQVEFDPYYQRYIDKLSTNISLKEGFVIGQKQVISFFKTIPIEKHGYRYAPQKWSIKEILQHLIDTERIFMYRCFRIARKDKTPLAGFDQNIYIDPSNADKKTMESLLDEYSITRQSSIFLLNSLSENDLKCIGNANGSAMSARAAAFTIIGHEIWHTEIINKKYLDK